LSRQEGTRLTNAFSKKLENFEAAVALNFAYYNFCKTHGATSQLKLNVKRSIALTIAFIYVAYLIQVKLQGNPRGPTAAQSTFLLLLLAVWFWQSGEKKQSN